MRAGWAGQGRPAGPASTHLGRRDRAIAGEGLRGQAQCCGHLSAGDAARIEGSMNLDPGTRMLGRTRAGLRGRVLTWPHARVQRGGRVPRAEGSVDGSMEFRGLQESWEPGRPKHACRGPWPGGDHCLKQET